MLSISSRVLWLILGMAGVLLVVQSLRLSHERMDHALTKTEHAQQMQLLADSALKAEQKAREEENRRVTEIQKVSNDAKDQIDRARADAVNARNASDRMRAQLAAFTAEHRGSAKNPTATQGSETTPDPIGVLADLLARADARAGILAEYADSARIAGQSCERAYEALIN